MIRGTARFHNSVVRPIRLGPVGWVSGTNGSFLEIRNHVPTQQPRRHFSLPPHKVMPMPSLSPTMEVGSIAKWSVKEGDKFEAGQVLAEVETDKATVSMDATDDGYVAKILVGQGEIKVGAPLMITVEEQEHISAFASYTSPAVVTGAPASKSSSTAAAPASAAPASHSRTPLIKFVGKRSKQPAAPSHVSNTSSSSSPPQYSDPLMSVPVNPHYTDIPNSNMRKVIAKRLTESKSTVPHFYVTMDCEIDDLLAMRKTLKSAFDSNVSVNDMVIKSAALALRDLPMVGAKWNKAKGVVEASAEVCDIAVAVATPNGLITPIVKAAHELGVGQVNSAVKDLAGRAREGKLKPEEYQGGSFSISNLGMFGISSFSAVINPPQACILAVGAGIPRILPPRAGGSKPRLATVVSVQLSADRRVVDEASAAQYLQLFSEYLANPKQTML